MSKITDAEKAVVTRIKSDYLKLSGEARQAAASEISWAENHYGVSVLMAFGAGVMFCLALVAWFHTL